MCSRESTRISMVAGILLFTQRSLLLKASDGANRRLIVL